MRIHHEATAHRHRSPAPWRSSTSTPARSSRSATTELLIATGGEPIRPDLPGIDLPFVRGVQTLEDAEVLFSLAEQGCRRIVVVGGGYIGLEMAEAFIDRGCTATVVERSGPAAAASSTPTSGSGSRRRCVAYGIDVRSDVDVTGSSPAGVLTSDGPVDADLVVLGIGVRASVRARRSRPASSWVSPAPSHVDDRQATSAENVWSAGDCAESIHRLTGQPVHIPLGTYANRHGRVAGLNMAGGDVRSAPVLGTAITKLCRARHRRHRRYARRRRSTPGSTPSPSTIDTTTARRLPPPRPTD